MANVLLATIEDLLGDPTNDWIEEVLPFAESTPAQTRAYLLDTEIVTGGDLTIDASSAPQINATVSNAAESTASALFGTFGGAVGGVLASNKISSSVEASIQRASVTTLNGDVSLQAIENAEILATADSSASSSGGSAFGTGTSLAINGTIATNNVLSSAQAFVQDSTINVGDANPDDSSNVGNVSLDAQNISTIDATTHSATTSGAESVGVLLAFNTIGYRPQNVLFDSLDALLGTGIGDQQPAKVQAYIQDSNIQAQRDVSLTADAVATLNARIDTASTTAASAFFGASGMSASGTLASNMVASDAQAYIVHAGPTGSEDIVAGGNVLITATDEATINAVTELVTTSKVTNDLGIGILNDLASTLLHEYQFTTKSGNQTVVFGDKVRVASDYDATKGTPGAVYQYMGTTDTLDLALDGLEPRDYTDFGLWKQLDDTNVIPAGIAAAARTAFGIKGGSSKSFYALVVRNDVDSRAIAYIDDSTVTAGGDLLLKAVEGARISALENSVVSAATAGVAAGGVMATNQVLSKANAFISDSVVTTTPSSSGT